jgi:ferrous iron transport protein A
MNARAGAPHAHAHGAHGAPAHPHAPAHAHRPEASLSAAATGHRVRILAIHAGRELRARLASMGLMPGVILTVTRAGRRNPTVVALKGARIVLGRGMADKIEVAPAGALPSDATARPKEPAHGG